MRIYVKTKPRAKKTSVERIDATHFLVCVTSVPAKGKANEAVEKALAGYFKVAKSRVALMSGGKSREKIFEVMA